MIASSSLSIAGPPAAPVSAFTLKPLSVHGLCDAVITIPAFAFLRIVAHEKDSIFGHLRGTAVATDGTLIGAFTNGPTAGEGTKAKGAAIAAALSFIAPIGHVAADDE